MPDYTVDIRLVFDNGPDLTVDLAAPFTIKQTRGLDPYMFTLVLSTIEGFPPSASYQDGAKCRLRFSTPGESGGRADSEWELYLVRVEPNKAQPGAWNCVFADERWLADYRTLTVSYNVQWPDGSFRDDTVPGGAGKTGRLWLVVDALEDAITKLGFTPDVSRLRKMAPQNNIRVPFNLGNTDYGGYVDAAWPAVFAPLLSAVNCDLIIGFDRKWIIVPKNGDQDKQIDALRAMKRIDDTVAKGENGWELPRVLKVGFEVMAEAVIESELSATTSGGQATFDVPENIMPRLSTVDLDPEEWWNEQNAEGVADTDWVEVLQHIYDLGYSTGRNSSNAIICTNWFLPQIIPLKRSGEFDEIRESFDPTENAVLYQKKLWVDATLRACFRRLYRITYPTTNADGMAHNLRGLAGIRFGRLTPGGDARTKGSVFCMWCEESTHALKFTPSDPFSSVFSDNHAFDPTRAAPFTARWIAQEGNELLFEIKPPESTRLGQAKIMPGNFDEPLTYGTWFNLSADGYLSNTEMNGEFDLAFDFRLYLCGGLTTEDKRSGVSSPYGDMIGRHLVVEVPLQGHEQGSIKSLDVKSNTITANFGYTKAQMASPLGTMMDLWPSALLNEDDVRNHAIKMASRVVKQFQQDTTGGITVAGVSPMQSKIITSGDIHEMSVVVGDPDPWSITTQYIIMPGSPAFDIEPKKRDGEKPALIAQE